MHIIIILVKTLLLRRNFPPFTINLNQLWVTWSFLCPEWNYGSDLLESIILIIGIDNQGLWLLFILFYKNCNYGLNRSVPLSPFQNKKRFKWLTIQQKDDKQAARDISHFEKRFSSFYNRLSPIQELDTFYDDHVDTDNVPSSYYNTQAKEDYNRIKGFGPMGFRFLLLRTKKNFPALRLYWPNYLNI